MRKLTVLAAVITVCTIALSACIAQEAASPAGQESSAVQTVSAAQASSEIQKSEESKNESAPAESGSAISTPESVLESVPESAPEESSEESAASEPVTTITGGTALNEAQELFCNTKYTGKHTDSTIWVSFTTGEKEDVSYTVTVVNRTVGSEKIIGYLYDKDEVMQRPTEKNNTNSDGRCIEARQDGTANSGMFNTLKPNTAYFLRLDCKSKAEYSLLITGPEGTVYDTTAERRTLSAEDVFEPSTNMDEAPIVGSGALYEGKYTEGYIWTAFRTGEQEDVPYTVTVENRTVGSEKIVGYLFNEYGMMQRPTEKNNSNGDGRCIEARQDGAANSGMFNTLRPDTVYFLRLEGGSKAEYSLRITDPNGTAYDVLARRKTAAAVDPFEPSTNMDEAPIVEYGARYSGKYTEGYIWTAFRTGEQEDVPYTVTVENRTAGSDKIVGYLFDEYGVIQRPAEKNNTNGDGRCIEARQDGTANSGMFNMLKPNTVYFLRLEGGSKAEYTLTISDPSGSDSNTAQKDTVVPGTSQSASLNVPLGTKVYGKYTEGYIWFAFTTTEAEDAEYYVTVVNCTVGSDKLIGYMVDQYGTIVRPTEKNNGNGDGRCVEARWDGTANSSMFNSLQPNTTYYVRVNGDSKAEYSLAVYAPGQEAADHLYETSSNLTEAKGEISENDVFYTGTNQNDATLLKHNVTYHGDYTDGYVWMAFTTGDQEDAEYYITVENLTVGSKSILCYLYDMYGICQKPTVKNNGNGDGRCIEAKQDGTANSCMFNGLQPNTTYYIRLNCESKAEYLITIDAPEKEQTGNTLEETVFEKPFELNETQVRFVGDEAVFVDEEEAKAALAPVAEIILAHPGHPILLAGTTATGGSQEFNLDLSDRRAAAVKEMLVKEFGVPEDQLITIGLGYEADPFVRGRDLDENGRQIETEAAKNRRVVVLDAESEIAKQILGE
ncbi:MAG: OmpA family protein [Firmicutes bacterium]|nr:OmpA family protein [Bacillota bacterium]